VNAEQHVASRNARWRETLAAQRAGAEHVRPMQAEGKLRRVVGLTLEAVGCEAPVGARCMVAGADGKQLETEVVGFSDGRLLLMPTGEMHGVLPNARVTPVAAVSGIPVGDSLLGRVIGPDGAPLDGQGPLHARERVPLRRDPINPMLRQPIDTPLDTGVRAINSLLTVGRGQRIGLSPAPAWVNPRSWA